MTSTNSPKVVDFGAHFYPELPDERHDEHKAIERYAGSSICTDIDALREHYSAVGVDGAVLSQPYYMGSSDAEAVARANDALLECIEPYDELFGLATLPVAAGGETAAAELRRALEAGYNGAAVETRSDSIELIDPELEEVFEIADRTGAPLLVHPKLDHSLGQGSLDDHWRLNEIFGREVALAECISKVIHEGIFEKYSNLSLVFHHLGGNLAAFLGRIEGAINRARRDSGDHLKTYEDFEKILGTRVHLDTSGYYGDVDQFRRSLQAVPSSHVLFATDFPYETVHPEAFQKIIDAIKTARGGQEREAILGGNAIELLVNVRESGDLGT